MVLSRLHQTASPSGACRDLDPKAPYWLIGGSIAGLLFYGITAFGPAPIRQLIHERGFIQALSIVTGGIVLGFVFLKYILLMGEQQKYRLYSDKLRIESLNNEVIDGVLAMSQTMSGVFARRLRTLLEIWISTNSPIKVTNRLDTDTEAFDLAQQNSYALPRILVWAIPILGFLGTVIGIGAAVGQFDSFLSNAEDIDKLRDGLAQVTGGLGTAFDTTFLALTISLIVMLPLAAVERLEQRLLTRIDLRLRNTLLTVLPDSMGGASSGINERQLIDAVNKVFDARLPNSAALVDPAKIYAEKAAAGITEYLSPLRSMANDSAEAIRSAKESVVNQSESIKSILEAGATKLDNSVQSLSPLLDEIRRCSQQSAELERELKQLEAGVRLTETLSELKNILSTVDRTLIAATKPRRVVLTEQIDTTGTGE